MNRREALKAALALPLVGLATSTDRDFVKVITDAKLVGGKVFVTTKWARVGKARRSIDGWEEIRESIRSGAAVEYLPA